MASSCSAFESLRAHLSIAILSANNGTHLVPEESDRSVSEVGEMLPNREYVCNTYRYVRVYVLAMCKCICTCVYVSESVYSVLSRNGFTLHLNNHWHCKYVKARVR